MKIISLLVALIINHGALTEKPSLLKNSADNFLSGKIIEHDSGESLTGAEIEIIETGQTFYSDFEGEFEISDLEYDTSISLRITYISYKKKVIRGLKPGKEKLIIELDDEKSVVYFSGSNRKLNT
ncbi:MAG: carboxypeptidase-like regulatory domain-containing protein [Bacteroidota bacterium]